MIDLLQAMTLVLVAWAALFVVFTGIGLSIWRALGVRLVRVDGLLAAFWLGWAVAVAGLQVWHLQFKVDGWPLLVLAIWGAAGLGWQAADVRRTLATIARGRWPWLVGFAILAIWLANHAVDSPVNYDSGLYHFTAVRWITTYPIVRGLGHLHGRLAFNSSYFLYVGLLDAGPWAGHAHNVAPGLLLLVLLAQMVVSGRRLVAAGPNWRLVDLFIVLLFAPACGLVIHGHQLASPSPDGPVFVLGLVLASRLLAFLVRLRHDGRDSLAELITLTAVASVGVTVKLSLAVFAAMIALIALAAWLAGRGRRGRWMPGTAAVALTAALVLIPWMVRGVMLSGYVAYPSTLGSVDVSWRMSRAAVENEAKWIRSWGRDDHVHYSEVLGNWRWLKPWAERLARVDDFRIPVALALAALFLMGYRRGVERQRLRIPAQHWLILMPSLPALVFWFFASPDIRFAGAAWWVLGMGLLALAFEGYGRPSAAGPIALALTLGLLALNPVDMANLVGAGSDDGFHPVPTADLETIETGDGLLVYYPVDSDQCWDAPLPCAPRLLDDLVLRRAGDLGGGFRAAPSP